MTRSKDVPISGPILQSKALQIAKELNINTFMASNGWLQSFCTRHNIVFSVISGESKDVPEDVV